ncbi:MAG: hypothetical protein MI923_13810 [Phycisphaerales bacterium]|nr:hypothetical protein [Phycisphaerales bacterium]
MTTEELKEQLEKVRQQKISDPATLSQVTGELLRLKEHHGDWGDVALALEIEDQIMKNYRDALKIELEPMTEEQRSSLKIFISHKHDDRDYADVVTSQLFTWGFQENQIFQSTSRKAKSPGVGQPITPEIKQFLHDCHLVIFIYTHKRLNWEWPAFEIGVAEDPKVSTMIVTLQIFDDQPAIQQERRIVQLTSDDVHSLVRDFHTRPNFFPGFGAYQKLAPDGIANRAQTLYDELIKIKQLDKSETDEAPDRESRWGYVRVRVDGDVMRQLYEKWENTEDKEAIRGEIHECLADKLIIVDGTGWALYHNGVAQGAEETPVKEKWSLRKLESFWRETIEAKDQPGWLEEVLREIWRFRTAKRSQLSWTKYPSAYSEKDFYPIVLHTDKYENGAREYDIYTFTA